jgi:pimeloyl-ACP methyl ester carboxylesterase
VPLLTTSDGASVAYSDTGAPPGRPDAPTIVFGHGLLFSGWMFRDQVDALRSDYRCVMVDWRGQGESPRANGGYDMDTLSRDAIALIEQLGLAPVHYVGLSMGGFVGQRIAARRPELVRSLVLLDTSAEPEDRWNAVQDTVLSLVYRVAGIAPVRKPVEKIMFGPAFRADPASKAIVDEWIGMLSRSDREGMRQAIMGVVTRKGVTDEIVSVTAPTLVAVGDHDAATVPAKARRIAELIPGARLEIIKDSGHSSTIEQPAAVTSLIVDFLGEVDGREQ